VRDRESGGAGQRELDDRDLADEAGDHHERQRHQRADQRIDQGLAEVEREHDQQHRAAERADQPGADQVLRAGRLGQTPLDDLAAARMPSAPASRDASSVLVSEMMFGDRPLSIAATSFSAAARVASPNRVHLYSAASPAAATITRPVRMNRLTGTTAPKMCTTPAGRMPGSGCGVTPKARIIADCAMSSP